MFPLTPPLSSLNIKVESTNRTDGRAHAAHVERACKIDCASPPRLYRSWGSYSVDTVLGDRGEMESLRLAEAAPSRSRSG